MGDGNRMQKVDMAKEFDKLSDSDRYFIKKLESMNQKRAKEIKLVRKKSLLTASLLGAGVLSIYFYTMYAVRQERFLEDFNKVPDQKQT